MGIIISILILAGLIKLLLVSERPLLCAGIYAGLTLFFDFISGAPLRTILLSAGISLVVAWIYFWILNRLAGQGFLWWFVAVCGFAIILI